VHAWAIPQNLALSELTHEFLITQITTWIEASDRDRIKALEMLTRPYEVY
jgi:hypothetical protein